jgi:acyl-CoA reductase-like NAD-dependent aldehyde dehydrogenase
MHNTRLLISDEWVDARSGFESVAWQSMTPDERGRVLWRIADILDRDTAGIAALETLDQGDVRSEIG